MDNLHHKLSDQEFSTGRKALLWIVGSIFFCIGFWDIYKSNILNDDRISIGVVTVTFSIGLFIYFVAFLASRKKKEHFFTVDNNGISFRFGTFVEVHGNFTWQEIDHINFPPHTRLFVLNLKNGDKKAVNLNWINKDKGKSILRHVYYSAGSLGVKTLRK